MTTIAKPTAREFDRAAVQRWLPLLDSWLLPRGAMYGVQHTWPQLYRSDGKGRFFAIFEGDELLSFCATRVVTVRGAAGPFAACLLGSVATAPKRRGQGLASTVLQHALAANASAAAHTLLWAEQDGLYARAGFVPGPTETCLVVARRPNPPTAGVRLLVVGDHAAAHRLHQRKPMRVDRDLPTMSALLTTPGMTALGLERDGQCCCRRGARACVPRSAAASSTSWRSTGRCIGRTTAGRWRAGSTGSTRCRAAGRSSVIVVGQRGPPAPQLLARELARSALLLQHLGLDLHRVAVEHVGPEPALADLHVREGVTALLLHQQLHRALDLVVLTDRDQLQQHDAGLGGRGIADDLVLGRVVGGSGHGIRVADARGERQQDEQSKGTEHGVWISFMRRERAAWNAASRQGQRQERLR